MKGPHVSSPIETRVQTRSDLAWSIAVGGIGIVAFAAFLLFAARAAVQTSLFASDRTSWLAVARLGMGYPLYIAVLAFVFWVCRRAHRTLEHQIASEREAADPGPL